MKKFIRELQRRNVIKAAISYVVFSWVLIQAASILYPSLGWEQAAINNTLIVLIISFPVWIVFAYVFEWTPTGFKKTEDVAEETSIAKTTSKKLNGIIIAGLSLAVLLLVADRLFNFTGAKETKTYSDKSIAVLAFEDMSPEKDQEYLSDGLADEIINSITIIKDIKVIGRTSSFQYKGKNLDARTIGEKLNVNIIVEGSIQKSGNMLRIITKMISVKDNSTIWSQRFDKESKDIFAIQDSIANKIIEKLKISLSDSEKPRLTKKQTDPEVYSLYLKGLYTYKKQNFDKSIEYNQHAIALDSSFAPSYAFLALAKIWKINESGIYSDANVIREAKEFAYRSVTLDPNLAEGYSALALLAWSIEHDFASSKINFEKSIELNPSASLIKNRYAYFLLWMGEFDKAEKLGLEAISSDPADWNGFVIVANANIYKKKFIAAEQYIAEGKKLFPENIAFDELYIKSKFYSGNYANVIQSLNPLLINNSAIVSDNQLSLLCISYLKKGNRTESNNIMYQLKERHGGPISSIDYNLARIYSQYQMKDSCFVSLERAFMKKEHDMIFLKIDPLFEHLKHDKRYLQLYHKYGFDKFK